MSLEHLVVLKDFLLTETAMMADVVLPSSVRKKPHSHRYKRLVPPSAGTDESLNPRKFFNDKGNSASCPVAASR